MKQINEKILYDEKRDVSYVICKKCGKKIYGSGTYEYGFYFDCKCGYSYIVPDKDK